jgi:ABC-type glutathione transport system ATPase component
MLRTPAELSDGQRYRFRLALALARRPATALPSVGKTQAEACTPTWLLADEFTATLDRTLAKVISFNVRRMADRMGAGFLLATTHEDIVEDLAPDVHVRCRLDGEITVETARGDESGERQESGIRSQESGTSGQRAAVEVLDPDSSLLTPPPPLRTAVKKKRRRSPTNSHSPPRPARTGRISRGGITAARASE